MPALEEQDLYCPETVTLLEAWPLTASERFFRFQFLNDSPHPYQPGQFWEISMPGIGEAPISVCSTPTDTHPNDFEVVVRRVGDVTNALHDMQPGQKAGVRGPFGTHFPVEKDLKQQDLLFICGGIGLAPVRSAIQYVLNHRDQYGEVTILLGTRTPADRFFTEELEQWNQRLDVTFLETVDVVDLKRSWSGNVGVITTLFPKIRIDPANTVAIVCGPPIMYKFVLFELRKLNLSHDRIFMSFERHMKCGVGKCGHCQINGIYACQQGPVFRYSDIALVKEAL